MKYVIYHTDTTYYMPGMKRGAYASKGAATAALNKAAKKTARNLEMAKFFEATYEGNNGDYTAALNATMDKYGLERSWEAETNTYLAERDLVNKDDYAIADTIDFHDNIEKMVTRVNLMSKKEYQERANTPNSCSPATETYWSM